MLFVARHGDPIPTRNIIIQIQTFQFSLKVIQSSSDIIVRGFTTRKRAYSFQIQLNSFAEFLQRLQQCFETNQIHKSLRNSTTHHAIRRLGRSSYKSEPSNSAWRLFRVRQIWLFVASQHANECVPSTGRYGWTRWQHFRQFWLKWEQVR